MFYFGQKSLRHLNECEDDLKKVLLKSISISPYDFSIIEGHRPVEEQIKAYRNGFSKIDGVNKKGKHNYIPSKAVDVLPYPANIDGKSVWDDKWRFFVIAGVILSVSNDMGISIRWGGDWDGDGSRADQSLHDLPHFELI